MVFCVAFTSIPVLVIDDASKLLIEQRSRLGSAANLVIRLIENGKEYVHLYSTQYSLCTDPPATSTVNPSDDVSW